MWLVWSTMFVTLCRADQVCQDILEEALAWTVSNLGHTSASRKTYLKLLSHVSDYLDPSLALDFLRQLQRCHLAADCYVLQSPHRVIFSDVVASLLRAVQPTAAHLRSA
jgi:hypothetical protein